jgi:diguanylate cyclase (GGDEF)-like protein
MRRVLRDNFQLAIVVLLCSSTIIVLTPFAANRFASLQWLMAAVDMVIILGMTGILITALKTGHIRAACVALALFCTSIGVGLTYYDPRMMFVWLYPIALANFFVLRPLHAVTINGLAALLLLPVITRFGSTLAFFEMMATLALVNIFAWVFSWKTEDQRRQLQAQATIDPLTGMGNRRKLDQYFDAHIRHGESQYAGAMILLDLDHFKSVNDRFGHSEGDKTLQKIAKIIHKRLRIDTDQVFRYGGEEFLLLLPNTNLGDALVVAESLRQAFVIEFASDSHPMTASFGCSEYRPPETLREWIARTDAELYQAKHAGRDCVRPAAPAASVLHLVD